MKILLINPPVPEMMEVKDFYIPSSLLYLASALRQAGEDVRILDLNTFKPWETHREEQVEFCLNLIGCEILENKPDVVGITCLFSGHIPLVLRFAETVKAIRPVAPVVVGGIHPTLYPREILEHCNFIDFVVIGEGEHTLTELVEMLKQDVQAFDHIDGIAFRQQGEVVVRPKTTHLEDLDALPFPAYDLVDINAFHLDTSQWHNPRGLAFDVSIPLISSRACPMHCNFCSMHSVMGQRWRARSAKNVVDEIQYLYEVYGARHFSFFDDQLTLNKKRCIQIADEIIRRNMVLQLESQNGVMVRSLDKESLDALVKAGLVRMALAIESGSDYIRNEIMGKKLPREKIFEITALTKHYKDLFVKAFFIIGMAEDTHETLDETYRMIQELDVDRPHVVNILPFPGTQVYEQARRENLFIDDLDFDDMWKYSGFYGTGNTKFFIKPYRLTLQELSEWRDRFDELLSVLMKNKKNSREMKGFPVTI